MKNVLAEFVCTKKPKFGHYVGEFATPGIGHLQASAGCNFVFLIWNILDLDLKRSNK